MKRFAMACAVLALAACGQPPQQKAQEIDPAIVNTPVEAVAPMPNLSGGEFLTHDAYEARLHAGTISDRTHICSVATEGGQVGMRCTHRP